MMSASDFCWTYVTYVNVKTRETTQHLLSEMELLFFKDQVPASTHPSSTECHVNAMFNNPLLGGSPRLSK